MKIIPAIDLSGGKVVRLLRGDYNQMTVYSSDPVETAAYYEKCGAEFIHVVDLDGAKDGGNPNFDIIKSIASASNLKVEVGGGIRSEETINKYLSAGTERVILGTVAVTDFDFTCRMIEKYGPHIAVGVDLSGGMVATHGWLNVSDIDGMDFCSKLEKAGIRTVICTDISKDGAMKGTNRELYYRMAETFSFDTVASGGVSSIEDIRALKKSGVYGAIVGKALFNGAIDLAEAVREAGEIEQ